MGIVAQARDTIAVACGRHVIDLEDDARLEELGLDSLDRIDLAVTLETAFRIDLADGAPETWHTVADVLGHVRAAAAAPPPFDVATAQVSAADIHVDPKHRTVSILLSLEGRFGIAASLPIAANGLDFAEKQALAESLARRLAGATPCRRGS